MVKASVVFGCVLIYGLVFSVNTQDELSKSMARGKAIYAENCMTCHLGNGQGVKDIFPPLAKADFLLKYPEKSIHAIKFGMQGPVKVNGVNYNNVMPPSGLEDDEIADVMNYIRNSFGNKEPALVTPKMVAAVKEK